MFTCGPPLMLPSALKRRGTPLRKELCSHLAHLWATSDCAPRSEVVRTPTRQRLCSHLDHLWATSDAAPPVRRWDPQGGSGYVATLPTCGPPLMLPSARKRRGPPWRQGLCSHHAHLWATSDYAPRSEAAGTPHAAGVM